MQIEFNGRRALVTGASRGIGRAIALALHRSGARVVALARTRSDLELLREACDCEIVEADLADPRQACEAARAAGSIDLLVNNAGLSIPQPFLETTVEALDATLALNVRAMLLVSQEVVRGMLQRGTNGAIVNVSSQASKIGLKDHAAYCASKGAVDQLTRVMALELAPHQIRVNAVNPTVTLTEMGEMAWSDPQKREPMLNRIPLHRFATPDEVAAAVAWLLSDQAGMISGVTLPVDGGLLAV